MTPAKAVALVSILVASVAGECAVTTLTPAAGIAEMKTQGRATRSLSVTFKHSGLPVRVAEQFIFSGGASYFVAAALPNGQLYSYTRDAGWMPATEGTLVPFFHIVGPTSNLANEPILSNVDTTGLVGTQLFAGMAVGDTLYFTRVGEVTPTRPVIAAEFPFVSGPWTVARTVNQFSDEVACTLSGAALTSDGGYYVEPTWHKPSKSKTIGMFPMLRSATTNGYPFTVDTSLSQFRVDAFTSSTFLAPNLSPAVRVVDAGGREVLYGNFEPYISQMMNGKRLLVGFVSAGRVVNVSTTIDLAGFSAAVDVFDYCVTTQ